MPGATTTLVPTTTLSGVPGPTMTLSGVPGPTTTQSGVPGSTLSGGPGPTMSFSGPTVVDKDGKLHFCFINLKKYIYF